MAGSRAVRTRAVGVSAAAKIGRRPLGGSGKSSASSFSPHSVRIGFRAIVEAMNPNQQPGIPDFTTQPQPPRSGEEPTAILPNGSYAGYTGADFPAPAGVPPMNTYPAPTTVVERPRHRAGAFIAAAAIAAVVGAGAGIGSYAFLLNDSTASSVSVTSGAAPQSPRKSSPRW
jgi:hypothetical protein